MLSLCWRLPIFPVRHQTSIVGASELNFRVRNGNGWDLTAIDTDKIYGKHSVRNAVPVIRSWKVVTRGGFEPPLPAWEAGVLGHLTNGPFGRLYTAKPDCTLFRELVHHQGLEPRTRWLRVSCSTIWASGAHESFRPNLAAVQFPQDPENWIMFLASKNP